MSAANNVGSLCPPQEITKEQTLSSDDKKHRLDCSTDKVAKRPKGKRVDEHLPLAPYNDQPGRTPIPILQNAPSNGYHTAVATLSSHQPQTWEFETTLVESIKIVDMSGLLGHASA